MQSALGCCVVHPTNCVDSGKPEQITVSHHFRLYWFAKFEQVSEGFKSKALHVAKTVKRVVSERSTF
ncbi:hypothetical protein [Klebsiella pneumoniae ISC21]|nr:hypothetical protein [Klebsiella pneumoniae ISC21]